MPGHTPGLQSLLVQTDDSGVFLLASDACNSRLHMEHNMLPGMLFCDKVKYFHTLSRIRAYEKAGVKIVFGHDKDEWPNYFHAPRYYT